MYNSDPYDSYCIMELLSASYITSYYIEGVVAMHIAIYCTAGMSIYIIRRDMHALHIGFSVDERLQE